MNDTCDKIECQSNSVVRTGASGIMRIEEEAAVLASLLFTARHGEAEM